MSDYYPDKSKEYFVISIVGEFLQSTRVWVYGLFGGMEEQDILKLKYDDLDKEEKEELDKYLSLKEVTTIATSFIRFDKRKKRYIITVGDYEKMVEAINSRLVSNIMMGLVRKGSLECGWDEERNDFCFWKVKEGDTDEDEKNI